MATRWACIGPGKISSDFFTAIKDNLPKDEHKFVAVASRDLTRAQQFADKFGFEKAYGSYDELTKDPDVEVVYIGAVHTSHVELSMKMIDAGKHVICEKPMAFNVKQVKMVTDLAKAKKKLFIEAVWSRWLPSYNFIKEQLAKDAIGEVKLVTVNFCLSMKNVERIRELSLGGGGLLDIGLYTIQFAMMVFNEMPESITAVGNITETGVDEYACIILKYKSGAIANLTYHTDILGENTATIVGKKGTIKVPHPFHAPTSITTPSGVHEFPLKDGDYFYDNSAGLQFEAADTRACLKKGELESSYFSHADSIRLMTIMDEVRRQIGMKYPAYD